MCSTSGASGSDVVLTHLRLEDQGTERIELDSGGADPGTAFPGEGRSHVRDLRFDTLGNITEDLNKHFGTGLTEHDGLAFDQFVVAWLADDELRTVARANDLEAFRREFTKAFERTILDSEERNHELYERLHGDAKFSERALDRYLTRMYELLRAESVQERFDLGTGS